MTTQTGYNSNAPQTGTRKIKGECLECGTTDCMTQNKQTGRQTCNECDTSWNPFTGDYPDHWHNEDEEK